MKEEQLNIRQKKDISIGNRTKQHHNHSASGQFHDIQMNSQKISLRNNLTKKSHKAPTIVQSGSNQQAFETSSQNKIKMQNHKTQHELIQKNQQSQLNKAAISQSFKNVNENLQKRQQNNEKKYEENIYRQNPSNKINQNYRNMQNYSQNGQISSNASIIENGSVSSYERKIITPTNSISTKNESLLINTNQKPNRNQNVSTNQNFKFQTQNNSAAYSLQTCSIQGYETNSQHQNQINSAHESENNIAKIVHFRKQQPLNHKSNSKNNISSSFHQAKNKRADDQYFQPRQKQFSACQFPKHSGAPVGSNYTPSPMNCYRNQQSQQCHQMSRPVNNLHGPRKGLDVVQNLMNNDTPHSHSSDIPSFLTKKLNSHQYNQPQKQPQRDSYIRRINGLYHLGTKNQINGNNLTMDTNFPLNCNTNSKSNLIVRNTEYGKKAYLHQRTKSHTKNYSSAQINNFTQNLGGTVNFLGKSMNIQNSHYQDKPQQQHVFERNQPMNPYKINFINKSNDNQKNNSLDPIAQKDQFSKVFVRDSNGRNDERGQLMVNSRHIQRQKQSSKYNSNKKIQVTSDSANHPMFKSSNERTELSRNDAQAHPYYINLKYIKSPANTQQRLMQQNQTSQLPLHKINNCDRYLKLNYEFQNRSGIQNHHRQRDKRYNKSSNSSVKDAKSETNSLHHKAQYKNAKMNHQKPVSALDYQKIQQDLESNQVRQPRNALRHRCQHQRSIPVGIHSPNTNLEANSQGQGQNDKVNLTFLNNPNLNTKMPDSRSAFPQRRQTHSFGFGQKRLYYHDQQPNYNQQVLSNTSQMKPDIRLSSPDHNINRLSDVETNNVEMSSPQHSAHKLTIFSPSHKNGKPAQKNHFITQQQTQNQRYNIRQKKSIKKMLVSQSKSTNPKSQILYSFNFKDLKGQHHQSRPNSRTLLEVLTKNQLTKIFCSTFKIGQNQNGCDCVPKCYWVDKWLEKVNRNKLTYTRSLIPKHGRNMFRQNLSNQNIFKNTSSKQPFSFGDVYDSSNPDQVQTFKQIQKDIPRTCSDHPTFRKQKYRGFLRQLLINFYYLDKKLGYVQGMNIIGAGIVYHSKCVYQSVQLMDFVMNVLNYRKLFENDMRKCRQISNKTCKIIRNYCYDLYNFVTIQNQVDLQIFIMGWYFSMLGSFVPLESMHFVINKFIEKQFTGMMQIIVTYFIFIKDVLMQKDDPNEIMQELSIQAMIQRSKKIDWSELISVSDKLKLSLDEQDF